MSCDYSLVEYFLWGHDPSPISTNYWVLTRIEIVKKKIINDYFKSNYLIEYVKRDSWKCQKFSALLFANQASALGVYDENVNAFLVSDHVNLVLQENFHLFFQLILFPFWRKCLNLSSWRRIFKKIFVKHEAIINQKMQSLVRNEFEAASCSRWTPPS